MGERRFSGFATILLVNGLGLMPVAWYGSEEQKRKWIGAATSDKNHEYLAGWTVSEPAGTPGGTANFDHLGVRPAFITAGRKIFSRQGRSDWLAIWPGPRRRTRSRTGVSIRILPRCVCAHRAGSSWHHLLEALLTRRDRTCRLGRQDSNLCIRNFVFPLASLLSWLANGADCARACWESGTRSAAILCAARCGRPNRARFLMQRFESCRPSQPVQSRRSCAHSRR
jgi:alkylation response protein AidB-like acyl-CoA dehydrogenase